uniref:TFIIS-type domain-containing protein n=1 Tax=viral metagenome TaxID=1070528 RepID=A0A6C0C6S1_9ZZZZ
MKISNPDTFRTNIRINLNKIIKKKKISLNLEKGIFNYTIQSAKLRNIVRKWDNESFVMIYIDKFKSILLNINKKSSVKNLNLLKKLKNGDFKAHEMAFMTHHELYPEKWKALIDKKIKRDKNEGTVDLSAATDEFFCFKCHKKQCSYYEMQTRSADEPMTTFVTCLLCGNNWRC